MFTYKKQCVQVPVTQSLARGVRLPVTQCQLMGIQD